MQLSTQIQMHLIDIFNVKKGKYHNFGAVW